MTYSLFRINSITYMLILLTAAENVYAAETTVVESNKSFLSKFSSSLSSTLSTDTKTFNDESKSVGSEFELTSSYSLNSKNSFGLRTSVEKGLTQGREQSLGNTVLSWRYNNLYNFQKLSLSSSVNLILPTNKDSRIIEGLNFAAEASIVAALAFNDKVSFAYIPRITKNFHEYKTSKFSENNVEYRLTQVFSLSYQALEKLSVGQTLIYANSWSYFGTQRDPGYVSISQLGYDFSSKLSASIGVANGGAIFGTQRGPDQRIQFFDQNRSSYFTSVQFVF